MGSGKIVIATLGSLGDVHPCMGVARALKAKGIDACIATSPYYSEYIRSAGIEFRPVRPDLKPNDTDLVKAILDPIRGAEVLHKKYIFPSIRDTTEDIVTAAKDADLLFTSILCYGAPIASRLTGLPWASGLLSPMALFSGHDPSLIAALPWLGKISWFSPAMHRAIVRGLFRISDSWAKPLHEYRREVGLAKANAFFDAYYSPYKTICMWSDPFGPPQSDWPASAVTTGFVFYDPKENDPLSGKIQDFLSHGDRPIVMTLGSTVVEEGTRFIDLFEKTAQLSGRRTIITVGTRAYPHFQDRSTDKILFVDYAPYNKLFAEAALIVHQGGVGTTAQGLRAGVPSIVLPFAMDQPDNAWRVERGKWGAALPKNKATPKRLAALIDRLLSNAEILGNCTEVAARLKSEDGASEAAKQLEAMLNHNYGLKPQEAYRSHAENV